MTLRFELRRRGERRCECAVLHIEELGIERRSQPGNMYLQKEFVRLECRAGFGTRLIPPGERATLPLPYNFSDYLAFLFGLALGKKTSCCPPIAFVPA